VLIKINETINLKEVDLVKLITISQCLKNISFQTNVIDTSQKSSLPSSTQPKKSVGVYGG